MMKSNKIYTYRFVDVFAVTMIVKYPLKIHLIKLLKLLLMLTLESR